MKKALEIGGLLASIVLIAFGVVAIILGVNGRSTVADELDRQNIVGSPDMTPSAIAEEAEEAGLSDVTLPSCDVAEKMVNGGDRARCFASYMQIHALEASGGHTYSEMGRFEAKSDAPESELAEGGGTDNEEFAVIDTETGEPAANGARELWVTETALSTALNTSYMAEQLAVFGIVVGVALLLAGIGFGVLVATGAVRDPRSLLRRRSQ